MTEDNHEWRVGDMCRAVYNNVGDGMLYRVVDIVMKSNYVGKQYATLKVAPIYGILTNIERRKTRTLGEGYCTYVSILDLGMEYMKLGTFIRDEAMRVGKDEEEPELELVVKDEDAGVCADVAARDE